MLIKAPLTKYNGYLRGLFTVAFALLKKNYTLGCFLGDSTEWGISRTGGYY